MFLSSQRGAICYIILLIWNGIVGKPVIVNKESRIHHFSLFDVLAGFISYGQLCDGWILQLVTVEELVMRNATWILVLHSHCAQLQIMSDLGVAHENILES